MSKKVLIVDDATTMRELVKFTLTKAGFEVIAAEDGAIGLKAALEHKPDLVVTDLNMPNMNGLELAAQLKQSDETKNIPILMLTTEAGKDYAAKGKEIGILGWIVKPFDPEKFSAAIKKVLAC